MAELSVCFVLDADEALCLDNSSFEKYYQNYIKPLISFLYAHPKFSVSFSFSGEQIDLINKKHPEAFLILSKLTTRKQVEFLGGGYYSPIFPSLYPIDRTGQIEKTNVCLRNVIGKRTRGLKVFGDCWDSSLVSTFQACGLDYVFLNSSAILEKNINCLPLITNVQGKSIKIFPIYKNLSCLEDEKWDAWLKRIQNFVKTKGKKFLANEDANFLISLSFSLKEFSKFAENDCFNHLLDSVEGENFTDFTLCTPQLYLKKAKIFYPAYILATMNPQICSWAVDPYEQKEIKNNPLLTFYDYLNTYKKNNQLYQRMLYVSMLLSQCKGGDKIRKQNASEILWKSQRGINFINPQSFLPADESYRQNAFKDLNEVEKIIRQANKNFKECVSSFDYNSDGLDEYICQMDRFNAVINLFGGTITDLNVIKGGGNYASNESRISKLDGVQDLYQRNLFVDHFISKDELSEYKKHGIINTPIFSNILFNEKKFELRRFEIHLEGKASYSSMKLPISIRKNYSISSSSISVQYIIKNDSPIELEGVFLVELNFANTVFEKDKTQYKIGLIQDAKKIEVENENYSFDKGVSFVQVSSVPEKLGFVIEPNEESGVSCQKIKFLRPSENDSVIEKDSCQMVSFFWDIKLSPGMEKEKTINFSIINIKK